MNLPMMKSETVSRDPGTDGNGRLVLSITRMTVHNGPGLRASILFKGVRFAAAGAPRRNHRRPNRKWAYTRLNASSADCASPPVPCTPVSLVDGKPVIDRVLCTVCGKCAEACNAQAIVVLGHRMTVAQIVTEVLKDELVFKYSHGGVTISGGEPLFMPGFALKLLKALKEAGINTGVDTCGQIPWSGSEPVLPYVDFFLWDIKHMDPKQHKQLTGVSNELILSNAGRFPTVMCRCTSGYR